MHFIQSRHEAVDIKLLHLIGHLTHKSSVIDLGLQWIYLFKNISIFTTLD